MSKLDAKIWEESFYWQYGAYPFFVSVYLKAGEKTNKKYFYTWENFLHHFSNGTMEGYLPSKDIIDNGSKIIDELLDGKNGFLKTFKNIHKLVLRSTNICLKSDYRDFDKWWPVVQKTLSDTAHVLFTFDCTLEIYFKKIQDSRPEEFSLLNSFVVSQKPSFLDMANKELLSLDKRYNSDFNKIYSKFFEKFNWLQNSYRGVYFLSEDWVKNHLSELKRNNFISKKEKILKAIPKKYKLLLETAKFGITFRDDKKKFLLIAVNLMEKWLKDVCQKNGWMFEKMRWLTVSEVLEAINGNKEVLNRADKYYVSNMRCGNMVPSGFIDVDTKLWDEIVEMKRKNNISILSGVPANKGFYKGNVRIIINPFVEGKNFKEKEVLVASMTRPEFLPLMKKAGAIVTDEGGITCHAAIVSRELGIPCIIGTKVATKVLKDGDMVEVDADNGVVKIVK